MHNRKLLSETLNNLKVTNFKNQVSFNETPGNFQTFEQIGNLIIICYQGENKSHNGDTLFTIPKQYAPKTSIFVPFTAYGAVYGQIVIETGGACKVNSISSTSLLGRIVFEAVYTI